MIISDDMYMKKDIQCCSSAKQRVNNPMYTVFFLPYVGKVTTILLLLFLHFKILLKYNWCCLLLLVLYCNPKHKLFRIASYRNKIEFTYEYVYNIINIYTHRERVPGHRVWVVKKWSGAGYTG